MENHTEKKTKKPTKIKKLYYARFFFRILVFLAAIATYIWWPETIATMFGFNMFKSFNIMHAFLFIWMAEVIMQFIPMLGQFSIGSLKHFGKYMKVAAIKDELKYVNYRPLSFFEV